jgi:uncharacterized protein YcaQ
MTRKKETISLQQARKLVLLSQRLPPAKQRGSAIAATLSAIEHLGYIQIDTISVIQRAHHHTLWARNPRYKKAHLEQLIADKQVFEYWSHAAAYLPMKDYRYSLYRKNAIASGKENHWYKRDAKLMEFVLKRIAEEGPLMAKDFENKSGKLKEWHSKPTKQALENLFMQGELMITRRNNFHKVYDLTERVIPPTIDTLVPTREEYIRFLITRYLKANGLGQASEIAYLLRKIKPQVSARLKEMAEEGALIHIGVGKQDYYALPDSLELLSRPLSRSKLKILSPFDNLLIQRKRMKSLFDFDYLIECYVPAAKRQYGYFSLPILWDGKLVARMDCKADRKTSTLHLRHLALEPGLRKTEAVAMALSKELLPFMKFNECEHIRLHRTTPMEIKSELDIILDRISK